VTVVETDQLGAKADGENQDPDAARPGDEEMAELMEKHDDRQNQQKRNDVTDQTGTQNIETPKQIRSHRIPLAPARSRSKASPR
jgi:hypothetical protein